MPEELEMLKFKRFDTTVSHTHLQFKEGRVEVALAELTNEAFSDHKRKLVKAKEEMLCPSRNCVILSEELKEVILYTSA